jgi:hypothetical protein
MELQERWSGHQLIHQMLTRWKVATFIIQIGIVNVIRTNYLICIRLKS